MHRRQLHCHFLGLVIPLLFTWAHASEDVRILGQPSLLCTKDYAVVHFVSSEPFQGRISVLNAPKDCIHEFSHNIGLNATAYLKLNDCFNTYYANNGSRIAHAHIDISFHPLVITTSDRVFHVQCIDNSFASVTENPIPAKCSHTTRPASRWEPSTFFRVGDSVVHEWNCVFDRREHGRYNTFLTNCNAISRAGEIIHMVDENGCIVDPDLLGEIVYNNYSARIHGRSRMFRFASGDMFRVECHLQMCTKEKSCGPRTTPPRCAYSKEEFAKRFDPKEGRSRLPDFNPVLLSDGGPFDHNIVVSSDWYTVHHNQFTDVDQLQDQFYLSTELNATMVVKPPKKSRHFLLGISFKGTNPGEEFDEDKLFEEALKQAQIVQSTLDNPPDHVTPIVATPITPVVPTVPHTSFEEIGGSHVDSLHHPVPANTFTHSPVTGADTSSSPDTAASISTKELFPDPNKFSVETPLFVHHGPQPPGTRPTTEFTTTDTPSSVPFAASSSAPFTTVWVLPSSTSGATMMGGLGTTVSPNTVFVHGPRPELFSHPPPLHAHPGSEVTPGSEAPATVSPLPPDLEFSPDGSVTPITKPINKHTDPPGVEINDPLTVHKKQDWRLDDGSFNETEVIHLPCNVTQTQAADHASSVCRWSGVEHLLLAWSLISAAAWILLLVAALVRCGMKRQPDWVEFSPRAAPIAMPPSGLLPNEHPWVHPDAFEHRGPISNLYDSRTSSARSAVPMPYRGASSREHVYRNS